ncbi:Eukaryotic translation initiation factor 4 gamma 1 [Holothuria leucospilota]|uniref:Eukaryotic translation initiation factor 4 gamma 1 n=1 Tax=Holothuria leucospilota TaxID=206669 RepID=A0A9Q0YGF4_HOLLE|nr:Eukaryotic translation initiation factor 4 gamma 1 [Holothuria leucospilota]
MNKKPNQQSLDHKYFLINFYTTFSHFYKSSVHLRLNDYLAVTEQIAEFTSQYWSSLGEIIGAMVSGGTKSLEFLKEVIQTTPGDEKAADNLYQVKKLWDTSKFSWSLFIADKWSIKSFVGKQDLDFTLSPEERNARKPPKQVPQRNENAVGEDVRKTKEFIHALVLAVCLSSMVEGDDGPYTKCQRELLKRRSVLIQRYIRRNKDLEMIALQVVEALYASVGNPRGVLRTMCEVLYDEDVISCETFAVWRNSEDFSEENELATKKFFESLDQD